MSAFSKLAFVRAYLSTTVLFRRRYHAPLSQTCTAGACACSCKSRRAPRPRKPDETLNRHGRGARRVALLAPRGVFGKYRHPLGYVGAITKIYVKFKSKSRILGDGKLIPSGGGVPEGRRGSLTPMSRGGSLFSSLSTPLTPSEHPRDEQPIRSVLGYDEKIERVSLSTTKPLHPQEGALSYFHVRGRKLIFFFEHAAHSERAPRDEQPIQSVLEYD